MFESAAHTRHGPPTFPRISVSSSARLAVGPKSQDLAELGHDQSRIHRDETPLP